MTKEQATFKRMEDHIGYCLENFNADWESNYEIIGGNDTQIVIGTKNTMAVRCARYGTSYTDITIKNSDEPTQDQKDRIKEAIRTILDEGCETLEE